MREYKVEYIDSAISADSLSYVVVHFSSGFSEKAKVYYNGQLIFKGNLITDRSTGIVPGIFIPCKFPDIENGGTLRVELLKSHYCGEFELQRNYQMLAIHIKKDGSWILHYRNLPYSVE